MEITLGGAKGELDIEPQRDDDASPMPSYRCMFETYLLNVHFSSSAQVKVQFRSLKKKEFKFVGFHVLVLVKTFPLMYQLLM